jgi:hypothetical protein
MNINKFQAAMLFSTLAAFMPHTSAATPPATTIATQGAFFEWLSGLVSMRTSPAKMRGAIIDTEPPECYAVDGSPIYSYARCQQIGNRAPKPKPTKPDTLQPCVGRECTTDPDTGP